MKKSRKRKLSLQKKVKPQNPVVKYAHHFNKSQVFKDKTKYQRKVKHKGKESFIVSYLKGIIKGFFFLFKINRQAHIIKSTVITVR